MWRLGMLDPAVSVWCATNAFSPQDPILGFLSKASPKSPRNYILTVLRLLSNAFASTVLAQRLISGPGRSTVTLLLIPTLLHEDAAVRTSAASLAFNVAAFLQNARIDKVRNGRTGTEYEDEDWEVEMVSAIVEAVDRENENEEVGWWRLCESLYIDR